MKRWWQLLGLAVLVVLSLWFTWPIIKRDWSVLLERF